MILTDGLTWNLGTNKTQCGHNLLILLRGVSSSGQGTALGKGNCC